jgi:hypothetical protein
MHSTCLRRALGASCFVLAALAFVGLSACGGDGDGGGGGGGGAPAGFPSTAANLSSANAPTYANHAALAARLAATLRTDSFLTLTATPGTLQNPPCAIAGTGPATFVLSPATGSVSGTATYTNFDRCYGLRLNGSASVTGTLIGPQVDVLNLTLSGLNIASGSQTFLVSGTATIDWQVGAPFGAALYVVTFNVTVSDGGGSPLFRLDNFRVDSEIVAGLENLFITGGLTTAEGFVDITPGPTRVELHVPSTGLQNGRIFMTGATTIANVFYNGTLPPTVMITPK